MKLNDESIFRRLRDGQRGQSMMMMMVALVGILGMAGFVIDAGRLYYGYQQLRAQTRAAALAAGAALTAAPSGDTQGEAASYVEGTATTFSGVTGNLNAINSTSSLLTNVTVSAVPKCLNTLTTEGILCSASLANYNAVSVTETATVLTTFARVIGFDSWSISATATASGRGGNNGTYNVAIILDTTNSMTNTDSDSQCHSSRISCALSGIRVLLNTLSPCPGGLASCGTASPAETATVGTNVAHPVDEVALFVFPGLSSTTYVPDEWACPTVNPLIDKYNQGPVYEVIPLSSNYRTSDTATALNTSSDTVIAVGGGCSNGVGAPGGSGTFYAGVIYSAQAYLVANARPNTKNVIIILSDGDATANGSDFNGTVTSYTSAQECHQAITAAQAAATAGTIVYSVAYGAEASGCTYDTSPTITPCETMQQIASNPLNFFSDYTATGGTSSCISAARPTSNLNEIFTEIAQDLTVSRLIPNNTL